MDLLAFSLVAGLAAGLAQHHIDSGSEDVAA
jgi:hypothetical protein